MQPCQPPASVVALVNDGIVTLLPGTHDLSCALESVGSDQLFDQFGILTSADLRHALAIFVGCNVSENNGVNPFALYHVASVNCCNRAIHWLPHSHEIRMTFTGDCDAASAQTGFWAKLLQGTIMDFFGITLTLTEVPHGYQLSWKAKPNFRHDPNPCICHSTCSMCISTPPAFFQLRRSKTCHHSMVESSHLARKAVR